MQFDRNLVLNAINFRDPNLELIKTAVQDGKYTDAAGFIWIVTSPNKQAVINLKAPIKCKSWWSNINTHSDKKSLSFFNFFWLRQIEAADVSLVFNFDGATINFTHKHDLQTRIATIYGRPDDLSKYTIDKARPAPNMF